VTLGIELHYLPVSYQSVVNEYILFFVNIIKGRLHFS